MTRSICLKFSASVLDAAKVRADELGYPSYTAYFQALLRADRLGQVDHSELAHIPHLPKRLRHAWEDAEELALCALLEAPPDSGPPWQRFRQRLQPMFQNLARFIGRTAVQRAAA